MCVHMGAWIYVLWSPDHRQVYVGQTGARDNPRKVLHANKKGKVPLYEWIMKVGVSNVIVTLLEKVALWAADSREIFWMHRFGPSNLLNRSISDLRQEKWSWLMTTKLFAKVPQKPISATARTNASAENFLKSGHSSVDFRQPVQLVLDSKKLCDPGIAFIQSKGKNEKGPQRVSVGSNHHQGTNGLPFGEKTNPYRVRAGSEAGITHTHCHETLLMFNFPCGV